jgi:hypothetical protein
MSPDATLRKKARVTDLGNRVNRCGVISGAQKRHFPFISKGLGSSHILAEVPPRYDATCL